MCQCKKFCELACRCFPSAGRGPEVAMLLEQRHADARLLRDSAGGRLLLSRDQPEQRGLPGAVASDDAPPVTARGGEGDERLAAGAGGTDDLEARLAMGAVMDGESTPAQLAALLMGLRMRGETDLAAMAKAVRLVPMRA